MNVIRKITLVALASASASCSPVYAEQYCDYYAGLHEFAAKAKEQGDTLEEVTQDLLYASRLVGGKSTYFLSAVAASVRVYADKDKTPDQWRELAYSTCIERQGDIL